MPSQRRTPAEQELIDACRRYVVAHEATGIPSFRQYGQMRDALRRVVREEEGAA